MKKSSPKLLQIAELGHPVLRRIAEPVQNVRDRRIQSFIDDMFATCKEQGGVGMAANQVHEPVRIMIVASTPTPAYPKAPKVKPFAIINPKLIASSEEKEDGWEGCMSVPGIRARVNRHSWVKVRYIDRAGKTVEKRLEGFLARIFQHELDHLDGIVFVDKALPRSFITTKEHLKLIARGKK